MRDLCCGSLCIGCQNPDFGADFGRIVRQRLADALSNQVGLGISSISQVGRCYSQNTKELRAYYVATAHDRVGVYRGFQLSPDDELRKRVIEQIMCFSRVDLNSALASAQKPPETYFADELRVLRGMMDDGLLSITDDYTIEVSPSGRFLVRSICSVFDVYPTAANTSRYSRLI